MGRCNEACPPHSWGGVMRPVLPIHGEVSAQPTEGLDETCPPLSWGCVGAADGGAGRDLSSPFMGRCDEACPPHSWGGVGAADGGADLKTGRSHTSGSVSDPFIAHVLRKTGRISRLKHAFCAKRSRTEK